MNADINFSSLTSEEIFITEKIFLICKRFCKLENIDHLYYIIVVDTLKLISNKKYVEIFSQDMKKFSEENTDTIYLIFEKFPNFKKLLVNIKSDIKTFFCNFDESICYLLSIFIYHYRRDEFLRYLVSKNINININKLKLPEGKRSYRIKLT